MVLLNQLQQISLKTIEEKCLRGLIKSETKSISHKKFHSEKWLLKEIKSDNSWSCDWDNQALKNSFLQAQIEVFFDFKLLNNPLTQPTHAMQTSEKDLSRISCNKRLLIQDVLKARPRSLPVIWWLEFSFQFYSISPQRNPKIKRFQLRLFLKPPYRLYHWLDSSSRRSYITSAESNKKNDFRWNFKV